MGSGRTQRPLLKSSLTHDALWNGAAQFGPQALSLITIPILIRALGIQAYGVWALFSIKTSLSGGSTMAKLA